MFGKFVLLLSCIFSCYRTTRATGSKSFRFEEYYEPFWLNSPNLIDPEDSLFSCLHYLINFTQSCENKRHKYFLTPLGVAQGFTSEFSHNYVYVFIHAVMTGARLIETSFPSRKWEYNCAEEKGWQCYFASSSCNDRYLESKAINLAFYEYAGTHHTNHLQLNRELNRDFSFIQRKLGDYIQQHHLTEDKRYHPAIKAEQLRGKCNFQSISDRQFFTIIYQYLFQFSDFTIEKINNLLHNDLKSFQTLFTTSNKSSKIRDYFAIHLRTTDKKYEMSPQDWNYITNAANLVQAVKAYVHPATDIKTIFVAADNCTLACEFEQQLSATSPSSGYEFVGACYARKICSEKTIQVHNPRDYPPEQRAAMNYQLLLELYFLSKANVFLGLQSSNIPRFVNAIRYGTNNNRTIFFTSK